jgi:uncharacterized protein (TIGR03083 family)
VGDLADIYTGLRNELSELVLPLDDADRVRPVPATPGWTITDLIRHLTGDVVTLLEGDYPRDFFAAMGDQSAVLKLNEWTGSHVSQRSEQSLEETFAEWDKAASRVVPMMRGDEPWPQGVPELATRVLITDVAVHQQDIYGALGIERDRTAAPMKIALAGYIAMVGMRLQADAVAPLRFEAEDKSWVAGGDDAGTTVRATRFEFFRALSGRRSPDQLRAYEWTGSSEPYLKYFYPYGVREEALVEG